MEIKLLFSSCHGKSHPESPQSSWICQCADPELCHCTGNGTTALAHASQDQDTAAWNDLHDLDPPYLDEKSKLFHSGDNKSVKGTEKVQLLEKKKMKTGQPKVYC